MESLNVIIAGVGGQGNVVASDILATALARQGYQVSVGETFGASQRGGSVMSHVRASRSTAPGPLIPKGFADVVVGFEPLETLRIVVEYGRESTRVVVNPRPVYPLSVQTGDATYPEPDQLVATLRQVASDVRVVEGTELARVAGDIRAQNVAMLGGLVGTGWYSIDPAEVEAVLEERYGDEMLRLNRDAFRLGVDAARGAVAGQPA